MNIDHDADQHTYLIRCTPSEYIDLAVGLWTASGGLHHPAYGDRWRELAEKFNDSWGEPASNFVALAIDGLQSFPKVSPHPAPPPA